MMQLNVLHRTTYRFTQPLTKAIELLRLTPLSCLTQTVLDWRIDVDCDARLRETRARRAEGKCLRTSASTRSVPKPTRSKYGAAHFSHVSGTVFW